MSTTEPTGTLDARFGAPEAEPTPWRDVAALLERAELYWARGTAVRVTDRQELQRIADADEAAYGSQWHFDVGDGVFGSGDDPALVFRVAAVKVLASPRIRTRRRRFASAVDELRPTRES